MSNTHIINALVTFERTLRTRLATTKKSLAKTERELAETVEALETVRKADAA